MADAIKLDLAAIKNVFDTSLDCSLRRIHSLTVEVSISPEIIAAILANELGILDSIIRPANFGSALLTFERD
jgi:hypothetical protein